MFQKKFKFLSIFLLSSITTSNFSSQYNLKTQNYNNRINSNIDKKWIDLTKEYKQIKPLSNRTLNDNWSWKEKKLFNYLLSKCDDDSELIIKFFFSQYAYIEKKLQQNAKENFRELILFPNILCNDTLNCKNISTNLIDIENDITKNVDICINCKKDMIRIINLLVIIYNYVVNYFGENAVYSFLGELKIVDQVKTTYCGGAYGLASNCPWRKIEIKKTTLSKQAIERQRNDWQSGLFSSNLLLHTLIHEIGHIFTFYADEIFSSKKLIERFLKDFLKKEINVQGLDDFTIYEIFTLATSKYANLKEQTIAEGFSVLLIMKKGRTKMWQLWNNFFGSYLPKRIAELKQKPSPTPKNYLSDKQPIIYIGNNQKRCTWTG